MQIDWYNFSPWSALAGGLLIGLSAGLLALANGRIAGISGMLGGLLRLQRDGRGERVLFLLGMLSAPLLWQLFATAPAVQIATGYPALLLAGLLVGAGSAYASGCTSGHGVCGLSRLSPRSIAATLCFMASGFATVYVIRHLAGV